MGPVSGTDTAWPASSPSLSWAVMVAQRVLVTPGVEPASPSQELSVTPVILALG